MTTRPGAARLARLVLALFALLPSGCRRPSEPPALPADLAVLIVVLDACRADKLGCYGFARETSPHLDAVAADPDAVLYRRHYVQGAWTKPSVASLFTGRYVHEHGVTADYQPARPTGDASATSTFEIQVLDARFETVAEHLRAAGFATVGAVKNQHPLAEYGFARGFDRYLTPRDLEASDREFLTRFLDAVVGTPGRVFGYLHVNACHLPFPTRQRERAYVQRYGFPYDEAARQAAGVDFADARIRGRVRAGAVALNDDDVRFLHLVYEAKLRKTDERIVRRLVEGLRAAGRWDDTLLIVTADHGEELYDHGGFGHGPALWEEIIHVPLIVKFPRGRRPAGPPRVDELTSAIDLFPALLDYLGLPVPSFLPGRRIFAGQFAAHALAERGRFDGTIEEWAVVGRDAKLIESPAGARLFDLAADAGERRDAAAERPADVLALRRTAGELRAAPATPAPTVAAELPPHVVEQLRRLGYLDTDR